MTQAEQTKWMDTWLKQSNQPEPPKVPSTDDVLRWAEMYLDRYKDATNEEAIRYGYEMATDPTRKFMYSQQEMEHMQNQARNKKDSPDSRPGPDTLGSACDQYEQQTKNGVRLNLKPAPKA